jgi:hypothetical protein
MHEEYSLCKWDLYINEVSMCRCVLTGNQTLSLAAVLPLPPLHLPLLDSLHYQANVSYLAAQPGVSFWYLPHLWVPSGSVVRCSSVSWFKFISAPFPHFVLAVSSQIIHPRLCVTFCNLLVCFVCWRIVGPVPPTKLQGCKTAPYRLSATAHFIHSQLHSTCGKYPCSVGVCE